jgi:hypothetical protein
MRVYVEAKNLIKKDVDQTGLDEWLYCHEDVYFYEVLSSEAFRNCGYTLSNLKTDYTIEDVERMKLYNDVYIDQKNSWQYKAPDKH